MNTGYNWAKELWYKEHGDNAPESSADAGTGWLVFFWWGGGGKIASVG